MCSSKEDVHTQYYHFKVANSYSRIRNNKRNRETQLQNPRQKKEKNQTQTNISSPRTLVAANIKKNNTAHNHKSQTRTTTPMPTTTQKIKRPQKEETFFHSPSASLAQ